MAPNRPLRQCAGAPHYHSACVCASAADVRYPLIGSVLVALQSILVQRDKRSAKAAAKDAAAAATAAAGKGAEARTAKVAPEPAPKGPDLSAVGRIAARAADDRFGRVLIFPEGTCGNGDVVLQFKTGAFNPGLPVQPVAVEFPFRHFDISWCR